MSRPFEVGDRIRIEGMAAALADEGDGVGTVEAIDDGWVAVHLDDDPPGRYWTFRQPKLH